MKSRIVYGLLALLLLAACSSACGAAPKITSKEDVPRITPQEVVAEQEAGEKIVLVDARSVESYQERHIVGAISVPMVEVADHLDELPKKAHIVFYCT
jgi:3-mercaptopyruvate sulfurtransferase SseA